MDQVQIHGKPMKTSSQINSSMTILNLRLPCRENVDMEGEEHDGEGEVDHVHWEMDETDDKPK